MKVQEIEHLADLARLELSPEELTKFGEDFTAILGYIDQLREVAFDGDMALGGTTINQMRVDVVISAGADELIDQAPARHDRYIKVQKIINNNDE